MGKSDVVDPDQCSCAKSGGWPQGPDAVVHQQIVRGVSEFDWHRIDTSETEFDSYDRFWKYSNYQKLTEPPKGSNISREIS